MAKLRKLAKIGLLPITFLIIMLFSCGNTASAKEGGGTIVPPPDWIFSIDGQYEIASGGFFTTELKIQNNTSITQTAVTTITAGGGFIEQFLGFQAPGAVEGTSSVWKASLDDAFQTLVWTVDVPAQTSVSFILLAQAIETKVSIAADGFLTWQISDDVLTKGISIVSTESQPVLRIDNIDHNPAWRGTEVCLKGQFDVEVDSVYLLYNQANIINQQPSRQAEESVCFFTTHFPSERFLLKVADENGSLSNGVVFQVIGEIYLPITLR